VTPLDAQANSHGAHDESADAGSQERDVRAVSADAALRIGMTPARVADFWSRTRPDGECLLWSGAKNRKGYGVIHSNNRRRQTHRVAYIIANGPIPDGMVVRHSCDRPLCVSPSHLLVGTQADNLQDMRDRGRARHAKGSKVYNSKLTEDVVLALRTMRAAGASLDDLASRFGTHKSNVSGICTGRLWRHAEGPITRERARRKSS
jgi:hypothetical protein